MDVPRLICSLTLVLVLVSCAPEATQAPSFGEAFVGPATLNLRKEISLKSPVVATVKHGERLDIVQYRHRFLKVRTNSGVAGWSDTRQLISSEQMAGILALSERSLHLPSQGTASTPDALNMHIDSNRVSPTFIQIPAGAKFDVVGHKLAPRTQPAPEAFRAPPPKPKQPRALKPGDALRLPPPDPPRLPANWLALSKPPRYEPAPGSDAPPTPAVAPVEKVKQTEPARPVPLEDWSLIRTADGKAGWVLSRLVTMAIPDDVAQYSEGHRITSYFPMGEVRDGDLVKYNWLWTTIGAGVEPYEFDSFRFFIWSRRHHRYETAYIERRVTGHYPIEVDNRAPLPTFALILEDDDGRLWKNSYLFEGGRVHRTASVPYQPDSKPPASAPSLAAQNRTPAREPSWFARVTQRVSRLFKK